MKLRPDQQRVKTLISDTITLLCKNGLNYNSEFCVEALIGITLDKDQVFIVNINETITKSTKFIQSQGDLLSKIRKRRASNEKSQTGEIQNGTITGENDVSARKSPRMDEVARSPVSLGTSGPDSMVNDTEIVSSTKSKHPLDVIEVSAEAEVFDLSYKPNRETSSPAVHVIRPDPNEESSHDHLVLNSGEGEKDDGNENVPPAPVEAYNNLLTGPPVWPGQEPPLSFTSGLHNSGSTALPSNQDGTNQSQEPRNKRKKSRPMKLENEKVKVAHTPRHARDERHNAGPLTTIHHLPVTADEHLNYNGNHTNNPNSGSPCGPNQRHQYGADFGNQHVFPRNAAIPTPVNSIEPIPEPQMMDYQQEYLRLQDIGSFSSPSSFSPPVPSFIKREEFTCTTCSKTFRSKEGWKIHMERHEGKSRYQCPHCPRGFMAQTHLKAHISEHTNELPWPCDACDMKFKYLFTLKKHRADHHNK